MKEKLQSIKEQALSKIAEAQDINLLNDIKVSILGKKGELTQVLKSMKDVAPEDRPKVGQMVNETRANIEAKLEEKMKSINSAMRAEKMKRETIDVTLPGVKKIDGHRHHRYRQESWSRASCQSVFCHRDVYSVLTK